MGPGTGDAAGAGHQRRTQNDGRGRQAATHLEQRRGLLEAGQIENRGESRRRRQQSLEMRWKGDERDRGTDVAPVANGCTREPGHELCSCGTLAEPKWSHPRSKCKAYWHLGSATQEERM